METVRRWMELIRTQLSGLSLSTKLLFGVLVLMVPMMLWVVGKYAGSSDMQSLGLSLDPMMKQQAISKLQADSIPNRIGADGSIQVPADRKEQALKSIFTGGVIPQNWSSFFDSLVEGSNLMQSEKQRQMNLRVTKAKVLGYVLGGFPGVRNATVMFGDQTKDGIGAARIPMSATVVITMSGSDRLDQKRVDHIARIVAGAEPELTPDRVTVGDGNYSGTGRKPGEQNIGDLPAIWQTWKENHERNVRDALGHPGARVVVSPVISAKKSHTEASTYTEPAISRETKKNSEDDGAGGAEPGVRANNGLGTGATAGAAATASGRKKTEKSGETEFTDPKLSGTTVTEVSQGALESVNCSVVFPYTYFIELYRAENKPAAPAAAAPGQPAAPPPTPTLAELQPIIDAEKTRIEGLVGNLLHIKKDEKPMLSVGFYRDDIVSTALASGAGEGAEAGLASVVMQGIYGKYGALGSLALLAVGWMLWMVKRSARAPKMPTPEELAGVPGELPLDDEMVGEVGAMGGTLEGVEMDEEQIRQKQLTEQVAELVKSNPGDAAALINRWIRKDELAE